LVPSQLATFPSFGPPDLGCLPGGADSAWIDAFAAQGGDGHPWFIPPDDVAFVWDVGQGGPATSGSVILDGLAVPQSFAANGVSSHGELHRIVDAGHLDHTLALSGKCGTVSRTAHLQVLPPPPPSISRFEAGPNHGYVAAGQDITLSWAAAPTSHCGAIKASISGIAAYHDDYHFVALDLPASGTVTTKLTYDTAFTLTARCSASQTSASNTLQLYRATGGTPAAPAGEVHCFKIQPPSVACFTVEDYLPSGVSGEAYERSVQSPGSIVTSISCAELATACGG
jgi:hypothetical protein